MSNDPLIGQKLGDYKIVGVLGQGGMARVYRGYDETLDRYSAVKVIEPNLIASEDEDEYQERFLREARSIARLHHPRVVSVFQFGQNETNTLYYMAMNFIDGRDLREILKEHSREGKYLNNAQVLRIMKDVAEALDYAHKQGVIHRDVKPSNIMITSDGNGVLTDFGLALNAQEGTIGNTFGSVHYIAPEQAVSSAQAVPQSDLYSLGVVLFEMMTGRVPFEDVSAMSVALKHISDPPPMPSTINARISEQVEEIIIKALDKDPQKRFKTGMAFVHALEGAFAADADEDTHDLVSAEDADAPIGFVSTETSTSKPSQATTTSEFDAISEDDMPTISDSKGSRPTAQQITESRKATNPQATQTTSQASNTAKIDASRIIDEEDQRQRRGVLIGVGVVIAILVIVGLLLASGALSGGDGDDDTPPDNTAIASGNGDADETAVPDVIIPPELTEEATEETAEITETLEAVAEETEEVTEEATEEATATTEESTEEATPTEAPTDTAEPTETPAPTDTPAPTSTPEPTETHTQEPSPTPLPSDTPPPPNISLRYDGRTLVLQNIDGPNVNVSDLDFVAINGNGSDGVRFSSDEWNVNDLNALRTDDCMMVWTVAFVELPSPDFCAFRQGIRQTPRSFWIASGTRTGFEVRADGEVLASCDVVPRENEFDVENPFAAECTFRVEN